ncbi:MAG: hypothetical protein M1835_001000 [Candelina submexicana]|nr:MAG: hypothetical protein M1835_001000 [Candelina submexicana]
MSSKTYLEQTLSSNNEAAVAVLNTITAPASLRRGRGRGKRRETLKQRWRKCDPNKPVCSSEEEVHRQAVIEHKNALPPVWKSLNKAMKRKRQHEKALITETGTLLTSWTQPKRQEAVVAVSHSAGMAGYAQDKYETPVATLSVMEHGIHNEDGKETVDYGSCKDEGMAPGDGDGKWEKTMQDSSEPISL